jgi:hypothetical protein
VNERTEPSKVVLTWDAVIYIGLPILSLGLLIAAYVIPLYPYAWESQAEFAVHADSDGALIIADSGLW